MTTNDETRLAFCYLAMTIVSLWWIVLMISAYYGTICGPD